MQNNSNGFLKPTEHLYNLQVLEEISKNPSITQRKLSQRLGMALGMTNACLKKMIQKGLVKVKGVNHKRIAYFLTPKGLSEKTKLTYHFMQYTISHYIEMKDNISSKLSMIFMEGNKSIVCYGAGEIAEIVLMILKTSGLDFSLKGLVDDDKNKQGKELLGFTIRHPEDLKKLKPDAVLVTSMKYREEIADRLNNITQLNGIKIYSI